MSAKLADVLNIARQKGFHIPEPKIDIVINGRYLQDITADAMKRLDASNDPPYIFVRGNQLVRLLNDNGLKFDILDESALRGLLARSSGFVRYEGQDDDDKPMYVKVPPPINVVKDILSLGSWPNIPPIEGIIETPSIRPDGSILDLPGYDPVTKLYYEPGNGLDELSIPDAPTEADAEKAAEHILDEVFGDFPFKDEASRANALAAPLSIVMRPAISGNIPLGLFDKPQAGTGASLLVDAIATITTGQPASMMSAPDSEDEWRKRITSCLMEGKPMIVIDNVVGRLGTAKLAQVLTAHIWSDRILGKSEMISLPARACWFATGNNLLMGGDIARRSYWSRLDAEMARPWLREEFKHPNLLNWIEENRAILLSDLLIMVRAWYLAEQPSTSIKPLGNFEDWARKISGVLDYAGIEGFLANRNELYDSSDPENAQWDDFLQAWHQLHQNNPISAATLKAELLDRNPVYKVLQEAIPEDISRAISKEKKDSPALGIALKKHVDQVYPSGGKLVAQEDTHKKTNLWKVEFAGDGVSKKPQSEGEFAGDAGNESNPEQFSGNEGKYESNNGLETSPALPAKWPVDSDYERNSTPANMHKGAVEEIDLQKFKLRMTKRQCCLCGRKFPYDLTPYFNNGKRGYICTTCHMHGPPPRPEKADAQSKLETSI